MKRQPSFPQLIIRSLADQWSSVQTLTIRKLVFLTFFWGALLVATFIASSLGNVQTQAQTYLALGANLFLVLLTASWIAIALQQATSTLANQGSPRHHIAALIAVLPTILIAMLLMWSTVSLTFVVLQQPLHPVVSTYAECVENGGLILQTNPAQCITTTNTFTDPRGVQ